MIDVEDQVRNALHGVPALEAPDDLTSVVAAVERRRRRQATGARLGAVAVVVGLLGGALVVRSGGGTGLTVAAPPVPSGTWSSLPEGPLPARYQQQAVWTGREVVVAGGCRALPDDCNSNDAAAYDPRARTWRQIADLPAGGDGVLVAAGDKVVLVTGQSSPRSWVWNPADDRWRSLGPVPLAGVASSGTYLTWTGTEVLAVGQFGSDGSMTGRGGSSGPVARLDLAAGRWSSGAEAPEIPVFGDAVWTGSEMLVAGAIGTSGSSAGRGAVAAYDPAADRWRSLPDAPIGPFGPAVGWSGTELVVTGFEAPEAAGPKSDVPGPPYRAAALDPATGRWRDLPDAPVAVRGQDRYREPVVGGRLVLTGPGGQLVALDPATGAWSVGSPPPLVRQEVPLIWTGSEVVVWGGGSNEQLGVGVSSCCTPVAGGEATPLP